MKSTSNLVLFLLFSTFLFGQNGPQLPEYQLDKSECEQHLRYLASDGLGGRRTGSEGGQMAADYIAAYFQKIGVGPTDGKGGYQHFLPFQEIFPPENASLKLGGSEYVHGKNMVVLHGGKTAGTAPAIFAGHGWADAENGVDDYANLDVKGKVVFVLSGIPGSENPFEAFKAMPKKRALAQSHGAIGLVELFRMNFPWRFFLNNLNRERLELSEGGEENLAPGFFHFFIQEGKPNPVPNLQAGNEMTAEYENAGMATADRRASNVLGFIEGTDDSLKNEYVLISAHYDHIGIGKQGGAPYTEQDSIFNGARDNGMGTVALMAAAEALAKQPPARSVILLACTGEEIGLLGSEYYVGHPVFPLEKTVFNLNNDGAGYNSTQHFTVIGLGLTNVDMELERAGKKFGLSVLDDPAPSQNLYESSDNFNFAKVGIPAIDIAPGITEMDEAIFKYYHQAADNPDDIDYDYLHVFCQTFAHMARLISDKKESIIWLEKYGK